MLIYWCQCPRSYFQIKKYYLAIFWLLIITFDVVRSQKCAFQVHYLKKRDVLLTIWHMSFFEQKVNSFIKILSKGSVLKSQFQNPQSLDAKNYFSRYSQKPLQIHSGTKNRLNCKPYTDYLVGSLEVHVFFISNQIAKYLTLKMV